MKKQLICILLINVLLSSCIIIQNSRTAMLNSDNSGKTADAHLEQILEGLESEDREKIKSLFSEQALSETDDIDVGIDYLFSFFQGRVVSWYKNSGPTVDEKHLNGQMTRELKSYYHIETDREKYFIFFLEYTVDTEHPENVGIYALRVVKEEDREKEIGYWTDMKIPGIYIPEEK